MAQLTQAQMDWLDPTTGVRPVITLSPGAGGSKVLDMGLRERRLSADGRRVILRLASDEAILQGYAPMADNETLVYSASSARAIVDDVLDVIYSGTTPTLHGTADADLTPFWELTNYVINPSVVGTTLGFQAETGTSAIDYSTTVAGALGTSSALRWTASGTGPALISFGTYTANAGTYYVGSCYVRSGTTARDMRCRINFKNSNGTTIKSVVGATTTDSAGSWGTRIFVLGLAPSGTAQATVGVECVAGGAGQFHYGDLFMFHEATLPSTYVDYFDGSIAPTGYTTAWEDTAHQSQSYRVPDVDRPMEALIWQTGQSAWDFLMPLLASVNLILWCTEEGEWWLDRPEDRAGGADIVASPGTSRQGDDTLSLDAGDNLDGVVVRYAWIQQRSGATRTKQDTAGTAGNVYVLDLAQPYPGPGTAAAILARRGGSGRSQSAEVILDYSAETGAPIVYTLPGVAGLGILGQCTSIDFDMRSGFMRATASGTVD
jgi:hypothetical protein